MPNTRGAGTIDEAGSGPVLERKRRELEAAAARRKLEEEALAEAGTRAASGDYETAELIVEHAVQQTNALPDRLPQVPQMVLAPVVAVTTPKVRAVAVRDVARWRMECGHERADDPSCPICQSVPCEYLVLDSSQVQARINGSGVNAHTPASRSGWNVRRAFGENPECSQPSW